MIAAFCSKLASNSGDAGDAVAAFDFFFFVMLSESKNVSPFTCLLYGPYPIFPPKAAPAGKLRCRSRLPCSGDMAFVGQIRAPGIVSGFGTFTALKQFLRCLYIINRYEMVITHYPPLQNQSSPRQSHSQHLLFMTSGHDQLPISLCWPGYALGTLRRIASCYGSHSVGVLWPFLAPRLQRKRLRLDRATEQDAGLRAGS
jgi:hypothetical protein